MRRSLAEACSSVAEKETQTSGATAMMLRAWKPSSSLCLSSNLSKSASCSCSSAGSPRTLSSPHPLGKASAAESSRDLSDSSLFLA